MSVLTTMEVVVTIPAVDLTTGVIKSVNCSDANTSVDFKSTSCRKLNLVTKHCLVINKEVSLTSSR